MKIITQFLVLALTGVFLSSTLCQAEEVESESTVKRLKSIMVQNVKYNEESLAKVLADLEVMLAKAQAGTEANQAALMLNFKNLEAAFKQTQSKVTLDLSNLSLYDALKMIGVTNGIDVKFKDKEIILDVSKDDPTAW